MWVRVPGGTLSARSGRVRMAAQYSDAMQSMPVSQAPLII